MKPYADLTDTERNERMRWAANEMRALPDAERDAAIAASADVLDARGAFEHRQKQIALARAYRKPIKPEGAA